MKKIIALVLSIIMLMSVATASAATVGVSMPTQYFNVGAKMAQT